MSQPSKTLQKDVLYEKESPGTYAPTGTLAIMNLPQFVNLIQVSY